MTLPVSQKYQFQGKKIEAGREPVSIFLREYSKTDLRALIAVKSSGGSRVVRRLARKGNKM